MDVITATALTKRYGATLAVDAIDFSVLRARPSGCSAQRRGKTTRSRCCSAC